MRSSFWKGLIVVGLIAAWAGNALAAGELDIVPFAGYRWGGSLSTIPGVKKFDVQDNWNYGVAIDKQVSQEAAAELYYSHFSSDWDATLSAGNTKLSSNFNRDDIELNGLWFAYRPGQDTRPYFTAGLGTSVFSSDATETVWRFAWNIGAGVRKDINPKTALRVEGRWHPTWVTTGSSAFCDPFYGCYSVGTGESFDQFDVTLGLAYRLGGRQR